jgi:hypothetical protein
VFGIIKHVMGFRHFLWRGLQAVRGEGGVHRLPFNGCSHW